MAGFWTKYFSTVLKGPLGLSWKQRREAKAAIGNARVAEKKLYDELPREVEQEHKTLEALKDEDRIINALKIAAEKGGMLAINNAIEDHLIMKVLHRMVDAWQNAVNLIAKLKKATTGNDIIQHKLKGYEDKLEEIARLFAQRMIQGINKAEKGQRAEYKEVMTLIAESHSNRRNVFMANLREKFKTVERQSLLSRVALRLDIGRERRWLSLLKKVDVELETLVKTLEDIDKGKPKDASERVKVFEALIKGFHDVVNRSKRTMEELFKQAYLIKRRDFLILLTILVNAETLKQLNQKWVAAHYLPETAVQEKQIKLTKVQNKIEEDANVLGQAFRIIIADENKLKRQLSRTA